MHRILLIEKIILNEVETFVRGFQPGGAKPPPLCPLFGRKKHKQDENISPFLLFPFLIIIVFNIYYTPPFSTAPSVAIIDVEHHDGNVLIVVVVLLRLVHELRLHLDDAVKGLVGDQCLVPDIQL